MPCEPVEVLIGQLRTQQLIEQPRTQPLDVRGARENFEQFDQMLSLGGDVTIEKVFADGVPAEWISAPATVADRAILFFHGGDT